MKTLEQQFAAQIYEQVKSFGDQNPGEENSNRKKYGSMAHKLPILVHTAGLTQALAFVDSRGKAPLNTLLAHLAQVVINEDVSSLLTQSREIEIQEYVYLTRKTMLALKWYKRFAQSILKVEPTDDDDENEDEEE